SEAEADHDVLVRATVLLMLPQALAFQGDASGARATAEAAIEGAGELGDVRLGGSYLGLSVAHLAAGDVALAADAAETAWTYVSDLHGTAAIDSAYMAEAALARGDFTAARGWADDAAAAAGWFRVAALKTRARVAIAEGRPDEADADAPDAVTCGASVKAYVGVPDILDILAGLAGDAGGHVEAARLFGAAHGVRQRTGEVRFPIYQGGYDASVDATRNTLSNNGFDEAWAEGA